MPKLFDLSKLNVSATAERGEAEFGGGQRISGQTAIFLNQRFDIIEALKEYQGDQEIPAEPEVEVPVSRWAKPVAQADGDGGSDEPVEKELDAAEKLTSKK